MNIYYVNITKFKELEGYSLLSEERKSKVNRYLKLEDKQRCLAAGLLLRYALGPPYHNYLRHNEYGKAYLTTPSPSHFNISHSGDYVALAIDTAPLGLDLEKITDFHPQIAKRCYTPEEQAWLTSQGSNLAFFKLWTGKEAVMKATGLGFNMPPETFDIMPIENCFHSINHKSWYLHWQHLDDTHLLCTASEHKPDQINMKELLPSQIII